MARRHQPSLRIPMVVRVAGSIWRWISLVHRRPATKTVGSPTMMMMQAWADTILVLRYAAKPKTGEHIAAAIAAPILTLANAPGESKADAYCVVASAVDALGNESALPDEDGRRCMRPVTPLRPLCWMTRPRAVAPQPKPWTPMGYFMVLDEPARPRMPMTTP